MCFALLDSSCAFCYSITTKMCLNYLGSKSHTIRPTYLFKLGTRFKFKIRFLSKIIIVNNTLNVFIRLNASLVKNGVHILRTRFVHQLFVVPTYLKIKTK